MRIIYPNMVYTRTNFTQTALTMKMRCIPKQLLLIILDALSSPMYLLAITTSLCYYPFPLTSSTEISPLF